MGMKSINLSAVLVVIVCGIISGCANGPQRPEIDGPVTIEVGNFAGPNESRPWLDAEIAAFEEAHPNIRVRMTGHTTIYDRERDQLHTNPPMAANVISIDSNMGYEPMYLAENDLIVPLDNLMKDEDFDRDAYYDNYWDSITYKGNTWGVPWHAQSVLMLLNWEKFEAAGIRKVPETWEEFAETARIITEQNPVVRGRRQPTIYIRTNDDSVPNMYASLIYQQGGSFFHDGEMILPMKESRRASEILHSFGPTTPYTAAYFNNSERRMTPEEAAQAGYAIQLVENKHSPRYLHLEGHILAPLPVSGKDVTFATRRLYFAVRKSTPILEEASWKFVKWMSRKDISLPDQLVGFPCRKDIVEHPDFASAAEQAKVENLDVLYTAGENGVDVGGFAIGRLEAIQVIWRAFYPALTDASLHDRSVEVASRRGTGQLQPMVYQD